MYHVGLKLKWSNRPGIFIFK